MFIILDGDFHIRKWSHGMKVRCWLQHACEKKYVLIEKGSVIELTENKGKRFAKQQSGL